VRPNAGDPPGHKARVPSLSRGKPIADSESTQKTDLEGTSRLPLRKKPLMLQAVGNPILHYVPPLGRHSAEPAEQEIQDGAENGWNCLEYERSVEHARDVLARRLITLRARAKTQRLGTQQCSHPCNPLDTSHPVFTDGLYKRDAKWIEPCSSIAGWSWAST
jgi:hypothetical protein